MPLLQGHLQICPLVIVKKAPHMMKHTITLVTQYYSNQNNYLYNIVINSTINNSDITVVELVADVSLVLYNLLLISQSSSVSVLVFLPSQIISSSHAPVYHMIYHCSLHSLSLPPGFYISLQQPPTSPPLHSLVQHCIVHLVH